jgi:histidine triad (HIT) family protein
MPETAKTNCPFCAIAAGKDSDADIVCASEHWVAFFPLEPATPGHTLVIPRIHVSDLWSADKATGTELMDAVIEVGNAIQTALLPEGMNLISSAGSIAEQTIFHLHLHLVPRTEGDRIGPIWPKDAELAAETRAELLARIRAECKPRS